MLSGQVLLTSPIDQLEIIAFEKGIRNISFIKTGAMPAHAGFQPKYKQASTEMTALLNKCRAQLEEYFAGKRTTFTIPLDIIGTSFQKKVWEALTAIPYGETRTYKEIAMQIGHPRATRAIGQACNRNPIVIIVPCHRVVGSNGLTGYAGGLNKKKWLLDLEGQ